MFTLNKHPVKQIGPRHSFTHAVPDYVRRQVVKRGSERLRDRIVLWRAPLVPENREGHWLDVT